MKEEGIYLRPSAFICGPHSSEGRIHLRPSAESASRIHLRLRECERPRDGYRGRRWPIERNPRRADGRSIVATRPKAVEAGWHGGARALVGNCCSSGGRRLVDRDGSGSGHRMRRVGAGSAGPPIPWRSSSRCAPPCSHHRCSSGVVNNEQGPGAFRKKTLFSKDMHPVNHTPLGAHLVRN